jgi:uncharacterized protein YndB with AHSA1/START domain
MSNVIDIPTWLKSLHREKRTGSPRSVLLRRRYPTNQADLWDAVTNPERVGRWFGTIEGVTKAGNTVVVTALGQPGVSWTAELRQCEPTQRFVMSWRFNQQMEHHDDSTDEVELRFVPEGDATILELEHRSAEPRPWEDGVGAGWEGALMSLDALVRGVPMEEMVALFVSGEMWPGIAAAWDEVKA